MERYFRLAFNLFFIFRQKIIKTLLLPLFSRSEKASLIGIKAMTYISTMRKSFSFYLLIRHSASL